MIEVAWGEFGNDIMSPGTTRLRATFEARGDKTRVELEHSGLHPPEAAKHAIGWPHFIERFAVAASGGDPGPDPWKTAPPIESVQKLPAGRHIAVQSGMHKDLATLSSRRHSSPLPDGRGA